MKTILKILIIFIFFIFAASGCKKTINKDNWSNYVEGYVTGSFRFYTDSSKKELTPIGYCILLKNKNSYYPMDYYTFNLPYYLVNYPKDPMSFYAVGCYAPIFFPDSLQNKMTITFQYKLIDEKSKTKFYRGFCTANTIPFPWDKYLEINLKNITVHIHK